MSLPRPALAEVETGTWGTCPYSYDTETKVMTLGAGTPAVANTPVSTDPAYWKSSIPHRDDVVEVRATGIVALPEDSSAMFAYCGSLTSVDGAHIDTSGTTNIRYLFSHDAKLANVDVSGWDTSANTSLHSTFNECNSLTAVDVSKWDTSKVTDMRAVFSQCTNLAGVDVSGWDTAKVSDLSNAFINCKALEMLDLSSWDTAAAAGSGDTIRSLNGMVSGCSSLTRLRTGTKFVQATTAKATLPRTMVEDESTARASGSALESGAHTYALSTVHFVPNGGSGSMADQVSAGDTALAANGFSRTGYTFSGWNTAKDGTGTSYADGATFPFLAESTTLYAQWKAKSYVIRLDANGGTVYGTAVWVYSPTDPNTSSKYWVTYMQQNWHDVRAAVRSGYTFLGYYDASGSQAYDASGHAVAGRYWATSSVNPSGWAYSHDGDMALHAEWAPDPAYRSVTVPDQVSVLVLPDGSLKADGSDLTVTNNSPYAVTLQGMLSQDGGTAVTVSADGLATGDVAPGGTRAVSVTPTLAATPVATADTQAAHIDWTWVPVG